MSGSCSSVLASNWNSVLGHCALALVSSVLGSFGDPFINSRKWKDGRVVLFYANLISVVGEYVGDQGFRLPNPVSIHREYLRSRFQIEWCIQKLQKMKILGIGYGPVIIIAVSDDPPWLLAGKWFILFYVLVALGWWSSPAALQFFELTLKN